MNRFRMGPGARLGATNGDRRLAALRIAICGYATVWTAARAPHLIDTIDFDPRRLDPVGPLAWIDRPLPAMLVVAVVVLTPLVGIAATLGWRYRVTAPLLALGFLFLLARTVRWFRKNRAPWRRLTALSDPSGRRAGRQVRGGMRPMLRRQRWSRRGARRRPEHDAIPIRSSRAQRPVHET